MALQTITIRVPDETVAAISRLRCRFSNPAVDCTQSQAIREAIRLADLAVAAENAPGIRNSKTSRKS